MAELEGIRLKSADDLKQLIRQIGFLPLFATEAAPEFSVEALTKGQWWTGLEDDPWVWREALSEDDELLYGKFFQNRAGFIGRQWLPDFANYRRNGYDFDSLEEEGLVSKRLADIMHAVQREGRVLTSALKKETGARGFEGAITALQMKLYLHISGFGRRTDRFGRPYGWSIACLSAPESIYGAQCVTAAYSQKPEASFAKILQQARALCPDVGEDALLRLLAGR